MRYDYWYNGFPSSAMRKQKVFGVGAKSRKGAARPCAGMFSAFGFLLSVQTNFSVLVGGRFHSFMPSPVGECLLCAICLPAFKGVSQEVLLSSPGVCLK